MVSFFLFFNLVQAPFLGAHCQSGLLSWLAPDFQMLAENSTPTNALHGGHLGLLPPALTLLRSVDPLLVWSSKQSQEELSKGPLFRHT